MLFNGVYYLKYRSWLPFVTGGAGVYFLRELFDAAPDPDSETRGGINLGFGTEYAVGTGANVRGEMRWDVVSHPTGFSDATNMSLTFGYKRYF
jgi:hypothetical protein